ncbi:MAG: PD-(D/E)XK nuclease family protein [Phycisphaeraceae bacterium]
MTTGNSTSPIDPMQALERFIVDNDDLLALEERVGRFNIFDALGITRVEIRHSNFLGWLLDPAESHGQGPLFLNAILMDLFKKARGDGMDVPLSPVELDGAELRGVDIRREWHNIDILIKCGV